MNPDFAANASSTGVRIAGTGSFVPDGVLTNKDLEAIMDTSDEWIIKRTGIKERRIVDLETQGTYNHVFGGDQACPRRCRHGKQ